MPERLAEIARHVAGARIPRTSIPRRARIILLEGGPRVLPAYPTISRVAPRSNSGTWASKCAPAALVTCIEAGAVCVGETRIVAPVVLWAAGVAASPLGKKLGAPARPCWARAGQSRPQHPRPSGSLRCRRSRVAQRRTWQDASRRRSGRDAGRQIVAQNHPPRLRRPAPQELSTTVDKGSLATIGRAAAVAQFGKIHISGFIAWLSWLFIHIFFLIGFRNRVLVFIQWAWSYVTYERGARLITGDTTLPGWSGMSPTSPTVPKPADDQVPTPSAQ